MFQKKSLGQNFLKSKKVIADIARAGNITAGETVLEAGPGEGTLTAALLEAGAKVVAIEKDRRLIPLLTEKFANDIAAGNLKLIEGDILEFSIFNFQFSNYKVVANIPYYITGAFIRKFLESENQPNAMVILVQKEVAERIACLPRQAGARRRQGAKESLLSISVKAYGAARYIQTVKAGSFSPAPKVDSAVLAIENISKKFFDGFTEEKFFTVLKSGFAHKRKLLSGNTGISAETLERLGISGKARAETLRLEDWKKLATL